MTAGPELAAALQRQVKLLEDDLRERVEALPEIRARWRRDYREAFDRGRTGASWQQWRDEQVTQAAVAWVLTTVFVRFCEDNRLVAPVWIAGPPDRFQEALDGQLAYFRRHPEHTDREWLAQPVAYLAGLPATAALVDAHSPLRRVAPSGDAASALLNFWRTRGDDGRLVHDFADESLSTRFLGDLYEELSAEARARYALRQTPQFVEEFILDRTLQPALAERPLEGFRLIDPACGSGHFLLGAFERILDRWHAHAPALEPQARVQAALDAVHGVDLNPYAAAIARFRLLVAALGACGLRTLEAAPDFRLHLAVGDSLLHGARQEAFDYGPDFDPDAALSGHVYASEDLPALRRILRPGRYDVVVGNPPYITAKDKALNAAYRQRYATCKGKYALTVPFTERFFDLARHGEAPGWVGLIISNAFMKREFGAPLIEKFLARRDLRLVVDTSGAYIPGHGTPTVIMVGCNRTPEGATVRAVLGIRGEPGQPADPANGRVWRSIVDHVDQPGHEDEWTSTVDLPRERLARHPWSLSGGGARELMAAVEAATVTHLGKIATSIGITSVTGEDDLYLLPGNRCSDRLRIGKTKPMVTGDVIRDFALAPAFDAIWVFDSRFKPLPLSSLGGSARLLETYRTAISRRHRFGVPILQRGMKWWEWQELYPDKLKTPLSIAFAFVATHNHFVLDRGGKVFNRSAPVIKLPEGASEDDHLALLGVLNSSTACFWLKQVSQNRGSTVDQRGARQTTVEWENFYEFTGTKLAQFPLPAELPLALARELDALAQELAGHSPAAVCASGVPTRERLKQARAEYERTRARMIALQEELDWWVYRAYRLVDEDLTYGGDDLPGLAVGERAFEITLARQAAAGQVETQWFARHSATPRTDIPAHWPAAYRELVARRIAATAASRNLALLERPEHKRRWAAEPWDKQEKQALAGWLLDRLEDRKLWFDAQGRPRPRSVAQLADELARDSEASAVLALWVGRPDPPLTKSLETLLADQAVPYLATYRYSPSGLRKRAVWEETWAAQRREDAGEKLERPIPVPPKYAQADFARPAYWRLRGKLDVPKERFIAYPHAGRDSDPSPLLGWAGWDHVQQALALNTILLERQGEGWDEARLLPLVAGLAELQPWLDQWHDQVDPAYGVSLAAYCRELLTEHATRAGKTRDELNTWRLTPTPRTGRRRATGAPS